MTVLDDWPVPDKVWIAVELPELGRLPDGGLFHQIECRVCGSILRYNVHTMSRHHLTGTNTSACKMYAEIVLGGRI